LLYRGVGIGYGLGLGTVHHLNFLTADPDPAIDPASDIAQEQESAARAFDALIGDYRKQGEQSDKDDVAELCKFYVMFLSSAALRREVSTSIADEHINAASALTRVIGSKRDELAALDNPYLAERASDLDDLARRLSARVLGLEEPDLSALSGPTVIVVDELPPSLMLSRNLSQLVGIVTRRGGRTSHAAILAALRDIPAVFAVADAAELLKEGEEVLIDAAAGTVETELDDEARALALQRKEQKARRSVALQKFIGVPIRSADGVELTVLANAGDLTEVDEVARICPEGIGLFRTEFLYLNRGSAPTEAYLKGVTTRILQSFPRGRVIARTLDVGGDKDVSYLNIAREDNPFLGRRGIRHSLAFDDIFQTSLRAFLAASGQASGRLRLMYPMVTSPAEVTAANEALARARASLDDEDIAYDTKLCVGAMIETPAAAVRVAEFLELCDFVSIGTNDLTQYTLAVDRGNATVAALYSHFDPAVLRLIEGVIRAGRDSGRSADVEMCGEMASDPLALPLLLGLGLRVYSVSTPFVLRTKRLLSLLDTELCAKLARQVMTCATADAVRSLLESAARGMYADWYF
jgi:phosphotransferase system enzyme I (PtsI)